MLTLTSLRSRAAWLFMAFLAVQVLVLPGWPDCMQPDAAVAATATAEQHEGHHVSHGAGHGAGHAAGDGAAKADAPGEQSTHSAAAGHCDALMACSGLMLAPVAGAGRSDASPPVTRHMLLAEHRPSAASLPPDTPPPRA
jgi:hypothetical protein